MKRSSPSDGHRAAAGGYVRKEKGIPLKGVLFDFDGTLTAPGALDFPAIKSRLGCPVDMPILEYLGGLPPRERSALGIVLEREERRAAEASVPNEGAETCIMRLVRTGYRLGILTRNSLRSVRIAFQRFRGVNLTDFSAVITREGTLPKPHPDGVCRAAEKMGLLPAELLVVGDFRFDIMAGQAAGATTALLVHGGKNPMRPGDPEPDYVIGRLRKIHDILDGRRDASRANPERCPTITGN